MPAGTQFSPTDVMMGQGRGIGPYLWTGAGGAPPKPKPQPPYRMGTDQPSGPTAPTTATTLPATATVPASATGTLGPQSIRATGSGPFDAAYRQNLATYAGGQFSQPSGGMSFNPTDISTFPGQPTGGGTAPITGMPQSLLDMALSGQGFSWTPPPPAQTATSPGNFGTLQEWMDQFMRGGRGGRMGAVT